MRAAGQNLTRAAAHQREKIGAPVTPAQASYTVEGRVDGKVVPVAIEQFGNKLIFLNFGEHFALHA